MVKSLRERHNVFPILPATQPFATWVECVSWEQGCVFCGVHADHGWTGVAHDVGLAADHGLGPVYVG
jgi:hypothetical protein